MDQNLTHPEGPTTGGADFEDRSRLLFLRLHTRGEEQRYRNQQSQHSLPDHASRPSLIKNHTIASEPTPSIHHAPVIHCAARLITTTKDSHPQVTASMASARNARLPIFSAMAILRWAK